MGMMVIENGKVVASKVTPEHGEQMHYEDARQRMDRIYGIEFMGTKEDTYEWTLTGLGTRVFDATTRRVTIGTGAGAGTSYIRRVDTITLSTIPHVINFRVASLANGADGVRGTFIGLSDDLVIADPKNGENIGFYYNGTNWQFVAYAGVNEGDLVIQDVAVGDLLTIVARSDYVAGFINGDKVYSVSDSAFISAAALYVGAGVYGSALVSATRSLGLMFRKAQRLNFTEGIVPTSDTIIQNENGTGILKNASGATTCTSMDTDLLYPIQQPTATAPAYVKGGLYFDTTLNKLRVGGAAAWETVTSA